MLKTSQLLSQKINYFDHNVQNSYALVLIHGNSLNAGLFHDVINSDALNRYRIIAVELPGHGEAGASENPEQEYSVVNYIKLIKALVQDLSLSNYVVFGHSLGGHIAINALPDLKGINGLAICGTPPLTLPPKMEECFLPNPAMGLAFKPDLTGEETHLLAESYLSPNNPNLPKVKAAIQQADPLVRAFIGKSIATELYNDETAILKNTHVPVAILHGQNDSMVNKHYLDQLDVPGLWKKEVQEIKNASHCAFIDNSNEFNRLLADFARGCFNEI
jgi:pimeloyl-ACP methyl ester carboxylesterase